MHLELIILEGSHAGQPIPLVRTPLTFGRSSAAGRSFPLDSFMSGMHLTVQHALSCIVLIDLHSSNGTFLNGERIRQAIAVPGDVIKIGTLTMKLVVGKPLMPEVSPIAEVVTVAEAPPAPAVESVPPLPAETVVVMASGALIPAAAEEPVVSSFVEFPVEAAAEQSHSVFEMFRQAGHPLFCLVDTAGNEAICRLLESAADRRVSLRGDAAPAGVPLSGPYLIQIDPDSRLLRGLVVEGWGRGWASFFTSTATFEALSGHFGRFYQVQAEAGEVYFRFYDPRVLREFLTVASVGELAAFFGPVEEWLLEAEDGFGAIRASNGADGLLTRKVSGA